MRVVNPNAVGVATTNTPPTQRPLPDFNLVMLAWYMSLIVGMTNAGEAEEIDSDDDSDVDMGGR